MPEPVSTTSQMKKRCAGVNGTVGSEALMDAPIPQSVATLLSPYLDVVRAVNERDRLRVYPGSPALARAWLRPQDRLIACELEPKVAAALSRNLHGDNRIKTLLVDGWTALKAYVPPKERRGLVLVDPPFEAEDDFSRLASGLGPPIEMGDGCLCPRYPIKGRREVDALAKRLRRLALAKALRAELLVSPLGDPTRLNGAGIVVVNPPWMLENELSVLLPALDSATARALFGSGFAWR